MIIMDFANTIEDKLIDYSIKREGSNNIELSLKKLFDVVSEEEKEYVKSEIQILGFWFGQGHLRTPFEVQDDNGDWIQIGDSIPATQLTYFQNRFVTTKNLELKIRYGLVLRDVFGVKDHRIAQTIIDSCYDVLNEEKNYLNYVFQSYLEVCLLLSKSIKYRISDTISCFLNTVKESESIPSNLIEFFIKNKITREERIWNDILEVLEARFQKYQSKPDIIVSYRICEIGQKIADRLQKSALAKEWTKRNGMCLMNYGLEREGQESKEKNPTYLAAYTFLHDSLEILKKSGDKDLLKRATLEFQRVKSKLALPSIKHEFSVEESKIISDYIDSQVKALSLLSSEELFLHIAQSNGFIPSMGEDSLNANVDFLHLMTNYRIDSSSNNAIKDKTDKEYDQRRQRHYGYDLTMKLYFRMFVERLILMALQGQKFTADNVLNKIKNSWLGEELFLNRHGEKYAYKWADLLTPAISEFIKQLNIELYTHYKANYILTLDSLVVKFEGIIRDFASLSGVVVTKSKNNRTQEKTLEELINDVEIRAKLGETNYTYFMYLYSSEFGLNIRNRVAHGLYKPWDYNRYIVILVLISILRMSNYSLKFGNSTESTNRKDPESSSG